jgi:hypothetical protein
MEQQEALDLLRKLFQNEDWYYDVGMDQYGRYVVYVHYMNMETMTSVPDKMGGKQVLCHFAGYKKATREQFTQDKPKPQPAAPIEDNIPFDLIQDVTDEAELIDDLGAPLDLNSLIKELDRMERVCGSNIMQDIFYEVHDKDNAVTNLSAKFPAVRETMERLYQRYGFDVIYENMDG